MTPEFRLLTELSVAGATGKPVSRTDTGSVDWKKLFALAREQSVVTLGAYGLEVSGWLGCPEELCRLYKNIMYGSAAKNIVDREVLMDFLRDFDGAGFSPVLIKGYSVADCYAAPECRLSSDADVWIDPALEESACRFMEEYGFDVEPRWKNGHHAVCRHPQIGCVELHVMLYDEIIEEIWFDKTDGNEFVCEPSITVDSPGGSFRTLGHTDHMIFLALHLIKHFIISGMNLRMMLDTVLFMEKHRDEIDFDRFWSVIDSLRYRGVFNCILWGIADIGGFDPKGLVGMSGERAPGTDAVMDDLELGGSFGNNDKDSREDGWYEYNRRMLLRDRSPFRYKLYMIRWKWDIYMKALFPTREKLASQYPVTGKRPWLIPFVWVWRLFTRGVRLLLSGALGKTIVTDEEKLSDSGKKRIELFRELGMI